MKATEGKMGRVFILRFDDGEEIPAAIEKFAADAGITAAYVAFNGGLAGGAVAAGTDAPYAVPFAPSVAELRENRSALASGLLLLDNAGEPRLQLFGALGFQDRTLTGSLRTGSKVWLGGEALIYEIVNTNCQRIANDFAGNWDVAEAPAGRNSQPLPAAAESEIVHAGDHTHLLYAFNAELN